MAKLKTFITTSGFFDLAVAAPSMKAALDIWGSRSNLFHTGLARETDDREIVKATMEKPGTVLRRAVGAKGAFKEQAELPKVAVLEKASKQKSLALPMPERKKAEPKPAKKPVEMPADRKAAAQLYDLAQKRREREEQRADEARQRERERREQAIEKAQADLDAARARYDERVAEIEEQREALDRKARLEKQRWEQEKEKLEAALKRARS
ncbi:MAG TPA: cell envelope biogenesis protein TolA [Rhizomicrobium sp.]|jgi:hypothetical protein|nr:cell envelope biogenesis protein TolA [Rhizomicrobium sp.]